MLWIMSRKSGSDAANSSCAPLARAPLSKQAMTRARSAARSFAVSARTKKRPAARSGTILQANKARLESQWHGFEAQIKSYFETVGKQLEQQQTAFQDMAAAQMKAWRQAADRLHEDAAKVAAARRAGIDDAVKQMKAQAAEVEDRLQKLKQAGDESWATLSTGLAESRKAFDHAIQQASDAFKRASPPKT